MGDAYRGLTIRLGADARPLNSALNSIKSSASAVQKQLNMLSKALKFDNGNITAATRRLDLASDKALHVATSMKAVDTAMKQASSETVRLANRTKDVYSETLRLRTAYNHVDAELQHIYDTAKRVYANEEGLDMKSEEVANHFKELKQAVKGSGDAALKARGEFEKLLTTAIGNGSGIAEKFGLAKNDIKGLIAVLDSLISDQKKYNAELNEMNDAEGFRAMEAKASALTSELKEAAMEAARFKSELYSLTGANGLQEAVNESRMLDSSLDKVRESARAMTAAFEKTPKDIVAAKAKVAAMRTESQALENKLHAVENIIEAIGKSPGFDKAAVAEKNVWLNAENAERAVADLEEELAKAKADSADLYAKLFEALRVKGRGSDEVTKLGKALKEADRNVRSLKAQLATADDALKKAQLEKEFREATEAAAALRAEIAAIAAQESRLAKFRSAFKSIRTMGYGLYSTVTPAIMMAGRYAIQAADDIDAAYRNMRKTVNGTEAEFEHLRDAAIEYSRSHFTSADQILEIEAMGGQLGIAATDLEAFATTISNLDIATNIDADTAAEELGKMASVLGISVEEYDNFGDALVRLGNNMPVLEGDVMTLMTRFMGMGKVVGMEADEMLAWSAAASATGQKAEAAGSSMQRFISKVETAVATGNDSLEDFAKIAGMSSDEFSRLFNADASQALYKFIEGLGEMQKRGESVNQALSELKIGNVRDKQLLEGLANQMVNGTKDANILKNALDMASDAYNGLDTEMADGSIEKAGDAAREAQRKAEGFSGALQIMKNNAQALGAELAEGAAPIISGLGGLFQSLTAAVDAMPQSTKTMIVGFLGAIAALGPLTVAVGAIGDAILTFMEMAEKAAGAKMFNKLMASASGAKSVVADLGTRLFPKLAASIVTVSEATGIAAGGIVALGAVSVAAVAGIIAGWVNLLGKIEERQNAYTHATEDATKYVNGLRSANDVLNNTYGKLSDSAIEYTSHVQEMNKSRQEAIDKSGEMVDSWRANEEEAESASQVVKYYSDKIVELAGNCNGSRDKLNELREAVKRYNELTGSTFEVTGEFSGALNEQTDAVKANTDAFIANAYAKAYQKDLELAIETQREWQQAYDEALAEYMKYKDAYQEGLNKGWDKGATEADMNTQEYKDWLAAAGNVQTAMKNMSEASKELGRSSEEIDKLNKAIADMQSAADGSEKHLNRLHNTAKAYIDSLGENGLDSFSEMMSGITDNADEFAAMLSDAGIGIEKLSSLGVDGFNRLYEAASGDMERIGIALAMLNAAEIDPHTMHVTEDGIEDVNGKLWQLDLEAGTITDGERVFKLTSEGIAEVTAEAEEAEAALDSATGEEYTAEIDASQIKDGSDEAKGFYDDLMRLNSANANPTVSVNDNASWVIENVSSKLWSLAGTTVSVGIDAIVSAFSRNAAGGFFDLHASGGFVTNGVTNLGRDRHGVTHIAGEAGREWVMRHADGTTSIVPIENRKYLRPYANTIASMIGGGSTSNSTYNITVNASGNGDDIARQVTKAIRAQELMRGRR